MNLFSNIFSTTFDFSADLSCVAISWACKSVGYPGNSLVEIFFIGLRFLQLKS